MRRLFLLEKVMDLYEEIRNTIKELERLQMQLGKIPGCPEHERGKIAGYNTAAAMLYSVQYDYETENDLERQ